MTLRFFRICVAFGAMSIAGPTVGFAASGGCSPSTQGATQGAGLGPSCEGQQPKTVPRQGTAPGQAGAGTGTTPGSVGGNGGGGAGGGGAGGGGAGGGGAGGGGAGK